MKISEQILKILEEQGEIELEELIKKLNTHPGVVRRVLEWLEKEGKIKRVKIRQHHEPKKFVIRITLA